MIGALGNVTKEFQKWIEKVGIPCNAIDVQKTVRNSKETKKSVRNVNKAEGLPVNPWSLVVTRQKD